MDTRDNWVRKAADQPLSDEQLLSSYLIVGYLPCLLASDSQPIARPPTEPKRSATYRTTKQQIELILHRLHAWLSTDARLHRVLPKRSSGLTRNCRFHCWIRFRSPSQSASWSQFQVVAREIAAQTVRDPPSDSPTQKDHRQPPRWRQDEAVLDLEVPWSVWILLAVSALQHVCFQIHLPALVASNRLKAIPLCRRCPVDDVDQPGWCRRCLSSVAESHRPHYLAWNNCYEYVRIIAIKLPSIWLQFQRGIVASTGNCHCIEVGRAGRNKIKSVK